MNQRDALIDFIHHEICTRFDEGFNVFPMLFFYAYADQFGPLHHGSVFFGLLDLEIPEQDLYAFSAQLHFYPAE